MWMHYLRLHGFEFLRLTLPFSWNFYKLLGLQTFYWTKWPPTFLFYIPLDLVRQETSLFAYPGTKPYMNQYAV